MNSRFNSSGREKRFFKTKISLRAISFFVLLALCLFPFVSPPLALALGILLAQLIGTPFARFNQIATKYLLQFSVVGLGFGMDIAAAYKAGRAGILFTVISIVVTLVGGFILGKRFKIDQKTSFLISSGTAICGGSAIAAIAPAIKAEEQQISVALGTIFILNALALFVFPFIGHLLGLSQAQFGIWSAIAIQDTSSVVGATSRYGAEALQIGTTVKLTRALWIIPLALISSWLFKSKGTKMKIPWFIGLFLLAVLVNTYCPGMHKWTPYLLHISKTGLTLTLFLIGAGLSTKVFRSVGLKPVLQGMILWVIISIGGLLAVLSLI